MLRRLPDSVGPHKIAQKISLEQCVAHAKILASESGKITARNLLFRSGHLLQNSVAIVGMKEGCYSTDQEAIIDKRHFQFPPCAKFLKRPTYLLLMRQNRVNKLTDFHSNISLKHFRQFFSIIKSALAATALQRRRLTNSTCFDKLRF